MCVNKNFIFIYIYIYIYIYIILHHCRCKVYWVFKKNINTLITCIIAILVVIVFYYNYNLNIKINLEIYYFNKKVFKVIINNYYWMKPDYYISYIDESCNSFINNTGVVSDYISSVPSDDVNYKYYIDFFNEHFRDIKYIKNDDDKYYYVCDYSEKQEAQEKLQKKFFIFGVIIGSLFIIYRTYKNIFK